MTPELMQQIIDIVIVSILTPVLTVIGGCIVNFVLKKTSLLRQQHHNNEVSKYLDLLDRTVVDVVQALQQEIVNDLKAKSADGTLTVEEIAEIKDKAIKTITVTVGDKGLELLKTVYGDLYMAINNKIHSAVWNVKLTEVRCNATK